MHVLALRVRPGSLVGCTARLLHRLPLPILSSMVTALLTRRAVPTAARAMRGVRFAHVENTSETVCQA